MAMTPEQAANAVAAMTASAAKHGQFTDDDMKYLACPSCGNGVTSQYGFRCELVPAEETK